MREVLSKKSTPKIIHTADKNAHKLSMAGYNTGMGMLLVAISWVTFLWTSVHAAIDTQNAT